MDQRLARWAQGFASIDYVLFCMAEEAVQERDRDTWRTYTYPDTYVESSRAGKHPSTFKRFLEGLSWELRQMGADCSTGDLLLLMGVFETCKGLGLDAAGMASIGVKTLKTLYRHYGPTAEFAAEVGNAAAIKAQHGTYYLPSFDQLGTIKYRVEFRKQPGGRIHLVNFYSIRDGEEHRNYFATEEEFHYFLKRTRASADERPAEAPSE